MTSAEKKELLGLALAAQIALYALQQTAYQYGTQYPSPDPMIMIDYINYLNKAKPGI